MQIFRAQGVTLPAEQLWSRKLLFQRAFTVRRRRVTPCHLCHLHRGGGRFADKCSLALAK
ncbi:hypothetical protein CP97_14652 [Aurantiacibacter atlanticus]|uniref:Uncharacterized protein n=1 Tax=Aurantiacibacter atlanticus TaxID=1648404 RepID=A0A168M082_9SPHN|nr:hypothetical protein CP97_14652 [Aurantiacibacter atlanticus]